VFKLSTIRYRSLAKLFQLNTKIKAALLFIILVSCRMSSSGIGWLTSQVSHVFDTRNRQYLLTRCCCNKTVIAE